MANIATLFKKSGGEFVTTAANLEKKMKSIRAFVFDWDGVFNDSSKAGVNESYFTEADSMGTNMLRFSNSQLNKGKLPFTAIISGEQTEAATYFAKREHFSSVYFKVKDKKMALEHFCKTNGLKNSEVAFVFDDVLDLSIAERVGVRILIRRNANPLFTDFVKRNKYADYVTGAECGNFALRESCELMIGLSGNYDKVMKERNAYAVSYKNYIESRNKVVTNLYTLGDNVALK